MEVRLLDFIKGNDLDVRYPRYLLRFFRKPGARAKDDGMRGKPLMLSFHLLNPGDVSWPRAIAAFEAKVNSLTVDNALDANVHFSLTSSDTISKHLGLSYCRALREVLADKVYEPLKLVTAFRHTLIPNAPSEKVTTACKAAGHRSLVMPACDCLEPD